MTFHRSGREKRAQKKGESTSGEDSEAPDSEEDAQTCKSEGRNGGRFLEEQVCRNGKSQVPVT